MITRKQYMQGEASHEDYYGQFVTPGIKSMVLVWVGRQGVLNSRDPHFNDIPLEIWDGLAMSAFARGEIIPLLPSDESYSLATGVCVLKIAARAIRDNKLQVIADDRMINPGDLQ